MMHQAGWQFHESLPQGLVPCGCLYKFVCFLPLQSSAVVAHVPAVLFGGLDMHTRQMQQWGQLRDGACHRKVVSLVTATGHLKLGCYVSGRAIISGSNGRRLASLQWQVQLHHASSSGVPCFNGGC